MSRLNDTAAIARRPIGALGGSVTTSVRKIDNGYVVEHSSYNRKTGQYKSSEEYCADAPDGHGNTSKRGGVGAEGLADTKRYLGSDV